MEFSDDGDLYQKIVQHQKQYTTFSESYIWKTLIQVTAGLKQLHQMDILHRDLKVFIECNARVLMCFLAKTKLPNSAI